MKKKTCLKCKLLNKCTKINNTNNKICKDFKAWSFRYVNSEQTPRERQIKYDAARFFGFTSKQATKMRDWSKGHLKYYLLNVKALREI